MRYISFYRPAAGMSGPPSPEKMAQMTALGERMTKAGKLETMGALLPAGAGKRVRLAGGRYSEEGGAGPLALAEGAGFAILVAADAAEQKAQIEEFLAIAGDGECMIVPLMGGD